MFDYYTYAYLRLDGTPYYIGKGKGLRAYCRNGHRCKPPNDSSRILILKKDLSEAEAFLHEQYMIFVLGRKDLGTGILRNLTDGGEGSSGAVRTEEFKQSRRGKNHPLFGKPLSQSTKDKLRRANLGKKIPKDVRERMSQSRKGRSFSQEHKQKIADSRRGKPRSDETKKKLSEANKGEKHPHYGKVGELSHQYGKKWWVNAEGQTCYEIEPPGQGWQNGRKWKEGKTVYMPASEK